MFLIPFPSFPAKKIQIFSPKYHRDIFLYVSLCSHIFFVGNKGDWIGSIYQILKHIPNEKYYCILHCLGEVWGLETGWVKGEVGMTNKRAEHLCILQALVQVHVFQYGLSVFVIGLHVPWRETQWQKHLNKYIFLLLLLDYRITGYSLLCIIFIIKKGKPNLYRLV
jgi:hypothetical protein